MRAFVAERESISQFNSTETRLNNLEKNFEELKANLEEIFTDYNDINEDTRLQIELINESLAKLQIDKKTKIRPKIGFKTED